MYSTTKRLSTLCVILAVIHAFMGIALIIYSTGYKLSFAVSFSLTAYIITSIISFICLSCGLRSLCSDLDLEYENRERENLALKKRIEALEFKVKL